MLGRPKLPIENRKVEVTICLLPITLEKLKVLAKKNNLSVSAMARMILERRIYLEEMEL